MSQTSPELRQALDVLFIAPFASHRWASNRGRSHWVDLEGWQDSIAGPLSAIANDGGCEYVYSRNDSYFAGVNDTLALRARLLEWHASLAAGVEAFTATTPDETFDLNFMRSLVRQMRESIEQACEVEEARRRSASPIKQGV